MEELISVFERYPELYDLMKGGGYIRKGLMNSICGEVTGKIWEELQFTGLCKLTPNGLHLTKEVIKKIEEYKEGTREEAIAIC